MRAVVQRVKKASVTAGEEVIASIDKGLVLLLGVGTEDSIDDANYLAEKVIALRIFEDEEGKMNKSLQDIGGGLLIVSQFTLMGDARKGRRPSFTQAASPEVAEKLYNDFVNICRSKISKVTTGKFQAEMLVKIYNDGPVTILLDSKKLF
ncbi:MAG: D-aminoacyl-tRNA deacylase [Thermoanaerobacteraceae bacterium]|jgi:D-tyrosyl-tRNA(Tyr) deacylase|uniref:D-aminoacyl-tRNA deacylase n=1 Tax=Biomaibacter acetigenes TaxID=2316383 RepID=A0A3G2R5L0_9FIRM|nr:D-aminoacyl-tRNA deacylase [Biomaibacter acetigenes]AYO30746.1 D-tyrosyl-tRNA(Tyr) deacylase [Biomaibacter acetigenes]MDK2878827.1 D-aminoacyl-tRNA deacylase [Thermoanaerobacteraceae bacterium]